MRKFTAALFAISLLACRTTPPPKPPLTPEQTQEFTVSASDIPPGGVVHTVQNPYYPDQPFPITVLPPGSTPTGKYEIVAPAAPEAGAEPKLDTTVPCTVCGAPVKIRIRRPPPTR